MRRFVVEVYDDNDITEQAIHIELLCRFGNMIAGVTEEAVQQSVHLTATPEPVCTCKVTSESYKNCDAHGNRRR